ncbi:MAG: hypothetical protein QM756_40995 [Polyangiaceae bacterium]
MSSVSALEPAQGSFNSGFFSGRARPLAPHEPLLAAERAIAYLLSQRLDERASLDGRRVGIQSSLSLTTSGEGSIELYELLDGTVHGSSGDPVRERWRVIAAKIEQKLGFVLEPELFSNMLFVACTANLSHPYLSRLSSNLLSTFRRSDARGLYHFFTSLRFACDIDCTGVAARARLMSGDIDLQSPAGRAELRQITGSHFAQRGCLRRVERAESQPRKREWSADAPRVQGLPRRSRGAGRRIRPRFEEQPRGGRERAVSGVVRAGARRALRQRSRAAA